MTQSNDPNDRQREIDRQLRSLNRRVDRLEYSQLSPQEFARAFERVYEEIDALEEQIDRRFDALETAIDRRLDRMETELNGKVDTIMSFITKLRDDLENR
jgi:biopolymer transport protein ExbB/TolQ